MGNGRFNVPSFAGHNAFPCHLPPFRRLNAPSRAALAKLNGRLMEAACLPRWLRRPCGYVISTPPCRPRKALGLRPRLRRGARVVE